MPNTSSMSAVEGSASTIASEEVSGWHVLTVQGYASTKKFDCGESFRSRTFAAAGHRWCMRYYPRGWVESSGEFICISLQLEQSCGGASAVRAHFNTSLLDVNGNPMAAQSHLGGYLLFTFRKGKSFRSLVIDRKTLEQPICLVNDSFRVRCDITVIRETSRADGAAAGKFVAVPPPDIDRHIGRLLVSGKDSADITLEVDGETFPAHRTILAARSPVFMAQLFGPMKKDAAAAASIMRIEGIEARVFEAFLHFVYNDSLPEIDDGETVVVAQHLLEAADRYGVERLKLICEDKLCCHVDTASVGTTLALAEQHGCDGLKQACLEFLVSGGNLREAIDTDGFAHLAKSCPFVLKDLLAKLAL